MFGIIQGITSRAAEVGGWALVALCLVATKAHASAVAPVVDRWRVEDGLPSNNVRPLGVGPDGALWLSTPAGLVQFDGTRFDAHPPGQGGADQRMVGMAIASDGVWLGSDGGGLHQVHEGRSSRVTGVHAFVRALAVDREGALWAATGKGVLVIHGGQRRLLLEEQGLPSNSVRDLVIGSDGRVFVATKDGAAVWEGGRFRTLIPGIVRCVAPGPRGELWAGLNSGRLVRWREGQTQEIQLPQPHAKVQALLVEGDRLWVGTSTGLALLDGETLRFSAPLAAAEGDDVRALLAGGDREGSVWVGTSAGGLLRVRQGPFPMVALPDPASVARAVQRGPDGRPWVATSAGLLRWDGERLISQGAATNARTLATSADGTWTIGIDDRLTPPAMAAPLTAETPVRGVLADAQGRLWVSGARVHLIDKDVVTRFPVGEGAHEYHFLYEGPGGQIWLATEVGVYRRSGGRFTRAHTLDPRERAVITSLLEEPDGVLWIGTTAGLVRMAADGARSIRVRDGLWSEQITAVLDDGQGRIWLAAPEGISWIARDELIAVATGRARRVHPISYGAADGIRLHTAGVGRPVATRDAEGRLWFVTTSGVLAVDPATLATPVAPTTIRQITVAGQPASDTTRVRARASDEVEVTFGTVALTGGTRVRCRYRLSGVEDWSAPSAVRSVRYPRLPGGNHRFEVTCSNGHGVWGGSQAAATISVLPPFYLRGWFFAAVAVVLAAAALGVHRLRLAQARGRWEAVLQERGRIAREVHDTLAQAVVAVSNQIENARRKVEPGNGDALHHLERASFAAREALAEARRSVLVLRDKQPQSGSELARAIDTVARTLSPERRVQVRAADGLPILAADRLAEIQRIAQEAIANALRHAGAAHVWVDLDRVDDTLRVVVRDDGRGFDPGALPDDRFGLVGMRERAALLGGRLTIESVPNVGSEVKLEVPL